MSASCSRICRKSQIRRASRDSQAASWVPSALKASEDFAVAGERHLGRKIVARLLRNVPRARPGDDLPEAVFVNGRGHEVATVRAEGDGGTGVVTIVIGWQFLQQFAI